MDLVAIFFSLLLVPSVVALLLWRRAQARREMTEDVVREAVAVAPARAGEPRAPAGRSSRMRRRPTAIVPAASSSAGGADEDDEEVEEPVDYYVAKAPRKKDTKKQEKEARREAEIAAREAKSEKQDRNAAMRRKKDEEREEEERRKEEAAQEQKAKEEQAANEEFDKWKSAFVVDTEGTVENDVQEESQGLLFEFVEYIKKHKCVALEDLAAEFNLRTQECINRVVALEQMGRISGVMDDRGKFIYISPEEMKAVADYIKRLGRVSIAHLASKSNEFIDLEPKTLETDMISCAQETGESSPNIEGAAPPINVS